MKDFFKYVGATVVGLIVFGLIVLILGTMSIVGLISSAQATQDVSKNSVLVLNLSGSLAERSNDNVWGMLTGKEFGSVGLDDGVAMVTVERIDSADIIKVPYRSKERRELPELDFGLSIGESRFIDTWTEQLKENAHLTKKQLTKFKNDNALENKKKTIKTKENKLQKK